ncbi:unnamed protein product, partial [Cuscuta epithymum]
MVASKWKAFNCLWVIALALGIIGVLCGIIAAVIGRRYRIQVPEDVALQCKRPGWAVVPALASHMLSAIIAVLLRASVPVASKCVRTLWVIARYVAYLIVPLGFTCVRGNDVFLLDSLHAKSHEI